MNEIEHFEHRLKEAEENIKELYSKVNKFAINQTAANTKLDNLLVTMGELKQSISEIKNKPAARWEKFVSGVIGAVAAGLAAAVVALILK